MKKKRKRTELNGWVLIGNRKYLNKEDLKDVTVVAEGTRDAIFNLTDKTLNKNKMETQEIINTLNLHYENNFKTHEDNIEFLKFAKEVGLKYVLNDKESKVVRNKEGEIFYYWNIFANNKDIVNVYIASTKQTPIDIAKL